MVLRVGAGPHPLTFLQGDWGTDTSYPLCPRRLKLYTNGVYISRVNPSETLSVPLYLATFAKAHWFQWKFSQRQSVHTAVSAWFKPKNLTKRSVVCPSENRGASMMVMSGLSQGLLANSCCLQQKTHPPARNIFSEVFCVAVSIRQRSCQQELRFLSLPLWLPAISSVRWRV